MKLNNNKSLQSLGLINELVEVHRKFQEFLDMTTASNLEIKDMDALIEIRQFNINCISKYTDLVSKAAHNLLSLTLKNELSYPKITDTTAMWEINNRLSMFGPVYNKVLKSKDLNSITRMIVATNLERIIALQENLIHPISERELLLVD